MKILLMMVLILNTMIFAAQSDANKTERKSIVDKNVKKQIELEKKYAKENTFYIDMKAAEVNPESLPSVPVIEPDDFNMDHVYD